MKQPLLLLHGAIGSAEQLKPLAEQLQDDCTVHLLNFAGHGGNAGVDHFSIEAFAGQTLLYIQQNNLAPISIFGYSMGGYVAMYLAVHHPELITGICALATKFYWDADIAAREVKMLNASKIEEKLPFFAATLQQRHAPADWKTVLQKTTDMLLAMGQQNPLSKDDFRSVQTPVLLMLGDRDQMVTPAETIAVYQSLPNAQLAVLPGTPHPIEQADITQVQFQVKQFLAKLQH